MFKAIGVTALEERLYTTLVDRSSASLDDLADASQATVNEVREALRSMETLGLVSHTTDEPRRFVPAPPDVAIEALVARHQQEVARARAAAASLMTRYMDVGDGHGSHRLVEIMHGRAAIRQRFQQLQHGTREELLVLDKPPYAVAHDELEGPARLLDGGVGLRTIYEPQALDSPEATHHIEVLGRLGEDARLLPELPLKLAIADRRLALVPLNPDQSSMESSALVHPCALLDALIALFEGLWQRAVVLDLAAPEDTTACPGDLSPRQRQLLQLMLTGMQDRAIARHFDVTVRTVSRWVADLMEVADAQTRLQLGWQAARRDWT